MSKRFSKFWIEIDRVTQAPAIVVRRVEVVYRWLNTRSPRSVYQYSQREYEYTSERIAKLTAAQAKRKGA